MLDNILSQFDDSDDVDSKQASRRGSSSVQDHRGSNNQCMDSPGGSWESGNGDSGFADEGTRITPDLPGKENWFRRSKRSENNENEPPLPVRRPSIPGSSSLVRKGVRRSCSSAGERGRKEDYEKFGSRLSRNSSSRDYCEIDSLFSHHSRDSGNRRIDDRLRLSSRHILRRSVDNLLMTVDDDEGRLKRSESRHKKKRRSSRRSRSTREQHLDERFIPYPPPPPPLIEPGMIPIDPIVVDGQVVPSAFLMPDGSVMPMFPPPPQEMLGNLGRSRSIPCLPSPDHDYCEECDGIPIIPPPPGFITRSPSYGDLMCLPPGSAAGVPPGVIPLECIPPALRNSQYFDYFGIKHDLQGDPRAYPPDGHFHSMPMPHHPHGVPFRNPPFMDIGAPPPTPDHAAAQISRYLPSPR